MFLFAFLHIIWIAVSTQSTGFNSVLYLIESMGELLGLVYPVELVWRYRINYLRESNFWHPVRQGAGGYIVQELVSLEPLSFVSQHVLR